MPCVAFSPARSLIISFPPGGHLLAICTCLCRYMFILSYSFFLLTGTIGFVFCLFFVRAIYSSVKID